MKKRFSALVAAFLCLLMFTACSQTELGLLAAFEKDSAITSVKTVDEISGAMTVTLPAEIKEEMAPFHLQSLLNTLSSFKIQTTTVQQNNKSSVKAQSKIRLLSEDLSFDTELFASVTNDNTQTIIKIPTVAKAALPEQYENAQYFSIDMREYPDFAKKINELSQLQADYFGNDWTPIPEFAMNEALPASEALTKAYFQFQKEYAKNMTDTPEIITKNGKEGYTVSLTDNTLKAFAKSLLLTYFEKDSAREALQQFADSLLNFYAELYGEEFSAPIQEAFAMLLSNDHDTLTNQKLQVELFFNLLSPVRLLGEDGIRIDYRLNSNGYITDIDAKIHLDFDINALAEAFSGERLHEEDIAFAAQIHYSQKREGINTAKSVSLPTLTKDNTLSYFQLLTDMMQEDADRLSVQREYGYTTGNGDFALPLPAEDGSISVVDNSYGWQEQLDFGEKHAFIAENGSLYVPMEEFLDFFGSEYDWKEENQSALFTSPMTGKWFWFQPGDNVICADGYTVTLNIPTLEINQQIYLPLKSFATAFTDRKVIWSEKHNAAYLIPYFYENFIIE